MSDMPSIERIIELERADAARIALEEAASRLEKYSANDLYRRVLRLGAKLIRKMKDELENLHKE